DRQCNSLRAPDSANPLSAQPPFCSSGPARAENSPAPAAWRWAAPAREAAAASYLDSGARWGAWLDESSAQMLNHRLPMPRPWQSISYRAPLIIPKRKPPAQRWRFRLSCYIGLVLIRPAAPKRYRDTIGLTFGWLRSYGLIMICPLAAN